MKFFNDISDLEFEQLIDELEPTLMGRPVTTSELRDLLGLKDYRSAFVGIHLRRLADRGGNVRRAGTKRWILGEHDTLRPGLAFEAMVQNLVGRVVAIEGCRIKFVQFATIIDEDTNAEVHWLRVERPQPGRPKNL